MKNINDRLKKWLLIAGGLALSVVLMVAIMSQFKAPPTNDSDLPEQNSGTQKVAVENPDIIEKEDDIKVPQIQIQEESKTGNGIDKGTDQTIQPDPIKPEYTDEQLKNPEQKPNGEKVTEQDKSIGHNEVEKPNTPSKSDNQPQGGEKKNGQIYVLGFGWIDDIGEGQGTVVDGEGDINKQVGIMGN